MLPTLGQLITPETDVTLEDDDYLFVALDEDGSRRVVGRGLFSDSSTVERVIEAFGTNVVFWGPDNIGDLFTALGAAARLGYYLPYPPADGIAIFPVAEAVNQVPEVSKFREHAARFAHQLDAAMGHHTLAAAEERDRLATYNTLADLIGNAWRKFQEWYDIDPQEIISGGNFDGTLLWKRDIDEYRSVHDYLCGECDIATFARRFILNANLDLFRRIYRQGLVYATNRDVTPWEPRFIDVATSPQSSFYEQLRVDYHLALTHYDHVIGVQDVQG